MSYSVILSTAKDIETKKIAAALVEKNLAACVNIILDLIVCL